MDNINDALITIGTTPLPTPSSYSVNVATLVDGQRNASGVMIGEEIRGGILRVDLEWNYLKPEQWADILRLFTGKRNFNIENEEDNETYLGGQFTNYVIAVDPETNSYIRRLMYISDRQSTMHNVYVDEDGNHRPGAWLECTLSLIEV